MLALLGVFASIGCKGSLEGTPDASWQDTDARVMPLPGMLGGVLARSRSAGAVANGEVRAAFGSGSEESCSAVADIAPCVVIRCGAPQATHPSAGTIMVAGAAAPVALVPDAGGNYPPYTSETGALFAPGARLSVSAAGDDVPAFSISTIAPSVVTVTQPALGASLVVDRTVDLSFGWTGAMSGNVRIELSVGGAAAREALVCVATATEGHVGMPPSGLAMLPAGSGRYEVRVETDDTIGAGTWTVTFTAALVGLSATGGIAEGALSVL